jgi:hypothetical protein
MRDKPKPYDNRNQFARILEKNLKSSGATLVEKLGIGRRTARSKTRLCLLRRIYWIQIRSRQGAAL